MLVGASWRRVLPTHFDDFVEWLRKDFDGAIRAFATSCVPEANGGDQRRWGYQVLRRSTLQSAIELLQCRCALNVEDRLSTMRVPTLLIHGSLDGVSPPTIRDCWRSVCWTPSCTSCPVLGMCRF